MGRADYLALGDWNTVCYQCGRKRKASTMLRHWQGYYVCPEHWEARQPQDFVRSIPDVQTAPWQQPPSQIFAPMCSPNTITAIIDYATIDCMIIDFISPMFDPAVTGD